MPSRRLALLAGFIVLAACSEQTLVGPEAQQAFEEARDRARENQPLGIAGGGRLDVENRPLIMVNGEHVDDELLDGIDVKSIDRIEVVKGEAAVEKYGERAAHGAILIFTKQGRG